MTTKEKQTALIQEFIRVYKLIIPDEETNIEEYIAKMFPQLWDEFLQEREDKETNDQIIINLTATLKEAAKAKNKRAILECFDLSEKIDLHNVSDTVFQEWDKAVSFANDTVYE